jgi:predicted transcriptional regulator YheO
MSSCWKQKRQPIRACQLYVPEGEFMEYKKLLYLYIPLIDFIADIIGSHCEVLLHDIVDVKSSVIAIRNGYISGRYIGCPLTDLELKLLEDKSWLNQNSLVNYRSCTDSGENLISSTHYIKDEKGELIGMLCVNILSSPDHAVNKTSPKIFLTTLSNSAAHRDDNEKSTKCASTSLDNVVDDALKHLIGQYKISAERMSIEEKSAIVQELCERGIFKIKGSITKVATAFRTSESTIYRYLTMK